MTTGWPVIPSLPFKSSLKIGLSLMEITSFKEPKLRYDLMLIEGSSFRIFLQG